MGEADSGTGPWSDAALIARVLTRDDRHAFAQLVRRHQSAVRGFLRRLTADEARADDLAQEAFLKTYRALASYRGGTRFSAWVMRIAYRAFLSELRGRREAVAWEEDGEADLEGPALEDLSARFDVERAMKGLSEPQRAALALTFGQDFTHEEAAAILEWPLGTLKTHVARGKRALRRSLGAYDQEKPT